jgi:(heptosyl)LPS beta-1,4-glucosyltransferase
MINTSAIIVIKGNPPYLEKTLASIDSYVDEIIIGVIDIPEPLLNKLKKNNKNRIFPLDSSIPFADLVKEKLKKNAKGKYILLIDPDEIFPQKAFDLINKNVNEFDYFMIPRKNIIFGKWIQHSRWWPDYQLRFFKKDSVIWPSRIHPIPQTKGQGFSLPATEGLAIEHYNYDNLSQYFEKALRYARSEAKKTVADKKKLTLGETFKKSLSEFISRYFAYDGYKDGAHGFILAFLQMFYYILVYIFYWEEKKYFNIDNEEVFKETRIFFAGGLKESNYWLTSKKLINKKNRLKSKLLNRIINLLKL